LPDRCREIFILRKLKQVPQKEIASRLGISERTVESQVTRGMKLCEAFFRHRRVHSFTRHD
jgi:RNA polymerase sigma factor (sigma-70 family)